MGDLPNDVKENLSTLTLFDCRTHFVASGYNESVLLAILLLLKDKTSEQYTQAFSTG